MIHKCSKKGRLTRNFEPDELPPHGGRGDLALVDALVGERRAPDLEDPVLRAGLVDGREPVLGGVLVHAQGQEVGVPVADPGDLWHEMLITPSVKRVQ